MLKKSMLPKLSKEKEAELRTRLDELIQEFRSKYSDILLDIYGLDADQYDIWEYHFHQQKSKF